jgi:signal transduction histidine kinase
VGDQNNLHEQLLSLHSISLEIAGLHELGEIHDRALGYCLELTDSQFGFTGISREPGTAVIATGELRVSDTVMDVAAIRGFDPDPEFYEQFRLMALRSSVVGVVIREDSSYLTNDVDGDPHSVGQPPGHPRITKFLGVPLRLKDRVIGMIGVANKPAGYGPDDERLLSTFAAQVAVAVDNARLYEHQRQMIAELRQLHERLTEAERLQLLGRERERIAGALHDQIQQEVFTIGVRLNALLEDSSLDPSVAEKLRELRQLSIRASDEIRRAIFALTSPRREGSRLIDELRSGLSEFERDTGIHAHLSVSGSAITDIEQIDDVVQVVVEESLTNVRKHAHARMVLVSLRYGAQKLDLVIQDDGEGAPEALLRSFQDSYLHFGLRHIRQLVIDRCGEFEIANGEEAGLVVRVTLPIEDGAK